MSKAVQELLPLTPVVFHTLLALADGRSHGYAIAQEVERQTDGKVRMGPGTLYGSLQRMCVTDLIEESHREADTTRHGERRRYYRMTPLGRKVLQAETHRLAKVVNFASTKVKIGKAGVAK